jgi:hypothetical protein
MVFVAPALLLLYSPPPLRDEILAAIEEEQKTTMTRFTRTAVEGLLWLSFVAAAFVV